MLICASCSAAALSICFLMSVKVFMVVTPEVWDFCPVPSVVCVSEEMNDPFRDLLASYDNTVSHLPSTLDLRYKIRFRLDLKSRSPSN